MMQYFMASLFDCQLINPERSDTGCQPESWSTDTCFREDLLLLKSLDELGNGGSFLANGDVNAVEFLGLVASVVPALLVQHSIESDSSLSSLSITNDKFSLTTADRYHGVDGLQSSLYRPTLGLGRRSK